MTIATYRQFQPDLGLEAPLTTEGAPRETFVRRRLNYRWLAGIVLTGLAGTGLMYLSVFGALAPFNTKAVPPQLSRAHEERPAGANSQIVARRGDKLIRKINLVAARQDYKAPILVRAGGAEVTRHAGFTRLATPLATESLGFAEQIPGFNLARLVQLASEDRTAIEGDIGGTQDSEVGLSFRDITAARLHADSGLSMGDDDALAQINDYVAERRRDSLRPAAPGPGAQSMLARVMRAPVESATPMAFAAGVSDPFSKLVVRMVPENVSTIPRQEAVLNPFSLEERVVVTKDQNSLVQSLRGLRANPKQIADIVAALTRGGRTGVLDGPRILKLTLQPLEQGGPKELMRIELFFDEQLVASAGRRDDGGFQAIEARETPQRSPARAAGDDDDEESQAGSGRLSIYASIHETARRYEIAPPIIDEIVRTVFFDVDLQRRVQPGDQLEILVANGDTDPTRQDLLLVALSTGATKRRYYRFKLDEDEVIDYFDEQGRSVKQFLIRKPIDGGELRSGFGYRRHPILGYSRLHSGVDWADKVGTPIRAAGNGTVRLAEWDSGYGRRVEIEHNHGYITTYSHMSAFAPGIATGSRVRQGQIIGRLGSSGLSTGPHLHYEVWIKGGDGTERPVDPLAIRLPKGRELAGNRLAEFRKERDFIEGVLKRAPGSEAQVARN